MAKKKAAGLPRELMNGVCWAFRGERYADRAAFDAAVRQYHLDIREEDDWRPDEVGLARNAGRITHETWAEDADGNPVYELTTNDAEGFTAGELLYQIHNAVVEEL